MQVQLNSYKKAINEEFNQELKRLNPNLNNRDVFVDSLAKTTKRVFDNARWLNPTEQEKQSTFEDNPHYYHTDTYEQNDVPLFARGTFYRLFVEASNNQAIRYNQEHKENKNCKKLLDVQLPILEKGKKDALKTLAELYANAFKYPADNNIENVFDAILKKGKDWVNEISKLQEKVSKEFEASQKWWLNMVTGGYFLLALTAYFLNNPPIDYESELIEKIRIATTVFAFVLWTVPIMMGCFYLEC